MEYRCDLKPLPLCSQIATNLNQNVPVFLIVLFWEPFQLTVLKAFVADQSGVSECVSGGPDVK